MRMDASAWVAKAPKRRSIGRRLPIGLAASLAVVLLSVVAFSARPRAAGPAASASASPTSRPGHFDNGTFSFDYPTNWRTISGSNLYAAIQVDTVIGTGDWRTGCYRTSNVAGCNPDTFDISGGKILVKVWRLEGGPAPVCRAEPSANVTLGPNAALKTTDGSATSWEIRTPGAQFGRSGNVFVEAHTDNSAELAHAEALVASFRWAPGVLNADDCLQSETPLPSLAMTHYNADGISFAYPSNWPVISGYQLWGLNGPRVHFAVGTGIADSGCAVVAASASSSGGLRCSANPTIAATGDQIVVMWYEGAALMDPPLPSRSLLPGETLATIGGMPAIESHGDGWVKWQLSAVGYIEARWGPGAVDAESAVDAVIASLSIEAPQTKPS